jgi:transposase, IS5 family
MSICREGLATKSKSVSVKVVVKSSDLLIQLANAIDWQGMADLALPDLMKTRLGLWWLGRKLYVRIHLAMMILQALLKKTDRGIETAVCQTPVYQVFCGFGIIARWHCPDHSKIEEFRNRLLPETHKAIADHVVKLAVKLGFADPSWMDLDSTVQEANISYPSDAALMLKLAKKCHKVWEYFLSMGKRCMGKLSFDLTAIKKLSKEYFFLAKNVAIEKRRAIFRKYHHVVKKQLRAMIQFCEGLKLKNLPWNIRQASHQIARHGWRLLLDIAHFIRTNHIKKNKILSLHCQAVACIKKGKVGKDTEFGRVFQLGRIGGNFIVPFTSTSLRMNDKKSFVSVLKEYASHFGLGQLKSISTDKGYFSRANLAYCRRYGIDGTGIQRPANIKASQLNPGRARALRNRRAGIEPLIGHLKGHGLRKSKMRSDQATLSAGYRSATGFNLHQLVRHLDGKAA